MVAQDGAAAARKSTDSWLTCPTRAQDATDHVYHLLKLKESDLPPQ